ncbi:2-dehydropantoate 2-reductase [Edaphobacter aggregans]|uniref:2-dehydropantoate 2-reductase n=1 Tax=Edaphobacter aggregans TaxID=570835 RepID=UPI0005574708|nr:2-dehydropantoate 2-reductase [Edaphobacter aggregans]
MARVAVVGAGAIGGVVASLLQSAGRHELVLCMRRPLKELVVETPAIGLRSDMQHEIRPEMRIEATILTQPEEAQPVDWVVVATKAYDAAGAALWLEWLCGGGAPVAVLQNGVEHRERFASYVAPERIVPVIVDCPAERRPADDAGVERIIQRGTMSLKVPEGTHSRGFVELFSGTAADAATVPDWTTVAWRKLCHNAAGVLPALLLQPAGVLRGEAVGDVALDLVRECVAVGRAMGATLSDAVPEEVLAAYRRSAPDSVNSLHADRLAGRPMEIDARNGVIVRMGKKHGIPTPANSMAVALLQAMTAR